MPGELRKEKTANESGSYRDSEWLFLAILIGKYGENANIEGFAILIILNDIFHASFTPWLQEAIIRGFFRQIWEVKIFYLARGIL